CLQVERGTAAPGGLIANEFTGLTDRSVTAGRDANRGMSIEKRCVRRQRLRHERVVAVQEEHVLAARRAESAIARTAGTGVGLVDALNAIEIWRHDAGRLVGRSVVDDDDLDRDARLPESALDRRADEAGAVVGRDDDAYPR